MLEYSIFQHFCSIVDVEPAPEKDLKMLTDNCSQLLPKTFNLNQDYEGSNAKTNYENLTPQEFVSSNDVDSQCEQNVTNIRLCSEDYLKIRTDCFKNELKQTNNNKHWESTGDSNFRNTVYNEDLLQISQNFSNDNCNSSNCSPQIARKVPTKRNRANKNTKHHTPKLDYFLNEKNDTVFNKATSAILANENCKFAANETANDANSFITSACKLSELKAGTNSFNPNSFLNETTSSEFIGYPKAPIANSIDVKLGCRLPESSSAIGASVELRRIPHSNIVGLTTPQINKTDSDLEESDYQDQDAIFYTANDLSQLTPDDDNQSKSDVAHFGSDEQNQTRSQENCKFYISHDHLDQSLSLLSDLSLSSTSNEAPKPQIIIKKSDSNSPDIPIISSNQTRPLIINYKSAYQNQSSQINSEIGFELKPDLPSYNRTPSPSINPALKERLLQEDLHYHMKQPALNFAMTESTKCKFNRANHLHVNSGSSVKNYLRPQGGSVRLKPNSPADEINKKEGSVGASSLQRSQSARAKPQLRSSVSPARESRRFLDPNSDFAGYKRQMSSRNDPNNLVRQKLPQRSQSARYKGAAYHGQPHENVPETFKASAKSLARQSSEIYYTNDGVVKIRDHRRSVSGRDPRRRYTAYGWDAPNDSASQREAQFMQLPGSEENYERLRNFSIKKGCVVNRGDSFRKRQNEPPRGNRGADPVGDNIPNWSPGKSCTEASAVSLGDSPQFDHRSRQILFNSKSEIGTPISRKLEETKVSQPRRRGSNFDPAQFNVSVLGSRGTGKSSLITQFMSSEYTNPFNADEDANNSDNNSVFILLEEVESKLCFKEEVLETENTLCSSQKDASPASPSVDGYILIFATNDMPSFQAIKLALESLTSSAVHASKHRPPIILVANKIDLARKRKISTAACNSLASAYQIKCVEISVDLNHHIDELLVGLLAQLRLHRQKYEANSNSMDGFSNTIPRRQLIHSNSSSIDNCDRSELDTDRSDASDNPSITPLLNPSHGRFRGHIGDTSASIQGQSTIDYIKKRRHASGSDGGSNNLIQGRQQLQQIHKGEAAKRGPRTSGIVSCASTLVSARNVLLGCLIRKRRPASADSTMM